MLQDMYSLVAPTPSTQGSAYALALSLVFFSQVRCVPPVCLACVPTRARQGLGNAIVYVANKWHLLRRFVFHTAGGSYEAGVYCCCGSRVPPHGHTHTHAQVHELRRPAPTAYAQIWGFPRALVVCMCHHRTCPCPTEKLDKASAYSHDIEWAAVPEWASRALCRVVAHTETGARV